MLVILLTTKTRLNLIKAAITLASFPNRNLMERAGSIIKVSYMTEIGLRAKDKEKGNNILWSLIIVFKVNIEILREIPERIEELARCLHEESQ
jgi:hypothetical protein